MAKLEAVKRQFAGSGCCPFELAAAALSPRESPSARAVLATPELPQAAAKAPPQFVFAAGFFDAPPESPPPLAALALLLPRPPGAESGGIGFGDGSSSAPAPVAAASAAAPAPAPASRLAAPLFEGSDSAAAAAVGSFDAESAVEHAALSTL